MVLALDRDIFLIYCVTSRERVFKALREASHSGGFS